MEHVFISYVSENWTEVKKIYDVLKSHNIEVWIDRNDIAPGSRWKDAIRKAIRDGGFFIACFSKEYNKRNDTYMNEELTIAIEELRQRPTDRVWFIPVQLNKCKIPDRNIGAGETLHDLQHVKLYKDWDDGIERILKVIQSESSEPTANENSTEEKINQNGDSESFESFTDQDNLNAEDPRSDSVQNGRLIDWVFQQGNFFLKHKQIDRAVEAYTHAIDLAPNNADTYNNSGLAHSIKGNVNHAIEKYNRAIELKPDFAYAYNNRGNAYGAKGDVERAISDYTKAIELKPNDAGIYYNRGVIYDKKGDHNRAIEDYTKTIQQDPNFAQAYNNRGVTHASRDQIEHAISDYTKAIELKPNVAEVYSNRGNAYSSKGEYNRAIKDYTKAIELKPNVAEVYSNRGNTYSDNGEYDSAIKDHNTAIKLKPDLVEAYVNRGATYGEKGDYDRAIKDFSKALKLNPNFAEAYTNRGAAYQRKGDYDRSIEDHNMAIQFKNDYVVAYYNRAVAFAEKEDYDRAIKDYNTAMQLNPNDAQVYNNRGAAYYNKGESDLAIKDYNKAIELDPNFAEAYYNRGEVWLHFREWDKAKADFTTAKRLGVDIIAIFHNSYKDVETYQKNHLVKLPEDLALLLTQRRRDRYPKTQKVLDADGKPLESPNVVNLRAQLRNAGTPLGEYFKSKPSFGINTAPTEAFVIDKATRDKLVAAHAASADILKPFLHGQDLRRWHVDTPQQWLIFTHRGIVINDYPAILKHLEKYQETLSKRKGKQKWYELPVSLSDMERFAQPKLVCPDTYNHQTFAVDTSGYYYGKTSYLIPTEETWLCGLLNSRTVEWFYSQVSNQLTIDPLRARSGYIQQIPIPDITPVHKALIAKIVGYLIYLRQQPEINSKDLRYARDRIMLGYFERVIDGLVYEAYLPAELHKSDKVFLQPLLDEGLPSIEEIQGDKMSAFRDIFELLYDRMHLVRRHLYYLDSIKPVRIIQGKL